MVKRSRRHRAEAVGRLLGEGNSRAGSRRTSSTALWAERCVSDRSCGSTHFLVEQLDAVGLGRAHGKDVEDGAAHGEVAQLLHLRHMAIAGGLQAALLGATSRRWPRASAGRSGDVAARRKTLHERGDRHHQHPPPAQGRQLQGRRCAAETISGCGTRTGRRAGFPIGKCSTSVSAPANAPSSASSACARLRVARGDDEQAVVRARRLGHGQRQRRTVGVSSSVGSWAGGGRDRGRKFGVIGGKTRRRRRRAASAMQGAAGRRFPDER